MPSELIKTMLEAGVHFGHKTSRWNPKMKKFIFGKRSGIYIIDLEKTEECLAKARDFLLEITSKGDFVLFVGTKKQAQEVVLQQAQRCGMFYVTERWLGGMLTNFATIKKSINRLKEIETMKQDGTYEKLTKKEVALLEKELAKLKNHFGGIVAMERMPKAVYIVDTLKEDTAAREARRLGISVIGLLDTNSDPDLVEFPIPGNDDATKSIQAITTYIADSVVEGRKKFVSYLSHESVAMKDDKIVMPEASEEPAAAVAVPQAVEEIAEIIEEKVISDDTKPARKAHPGAAAGPDKGRARKKA